MMGILTLVQEQRFPKPEFQSGYEVPETVIPQPDSFLMDYLDVGLLVLVMSLTAWFIFKKRSRKGILWLSVFSLAYFGFFREGCICSVGSIQNMALALFGEGYAVPFTVILTFAIPLLFALVMGRLFCASACPLGVIQDLVIVKPIKVAPWIQKSLGLFPFVYLAFAVLYAATGTDFIICKFDPFVGFFRLGAEFHMLVLGVAFLLIGMFVTEKYILSMGPMGHVMCLDRVTGDFLWGMDIAKKYGSEIPLWYTGQCPLIVDGVAVLATGGNALLVGVDCATGKVLWETPNPDGWKMSHSSVTPYEFNGMKMLVYSAVGGVVGVGSSGKILWKTNAWNKSVVAPSPICMPNGKIFLSAGYGAGSMVLQLKQQGDLFNVEIFKSFKPGDGLSSEQQTPILLDGHLYGILPKDAKTLRNQMVCVSADDPTKVVWSSGSDIKFGLGPYILADDRFYILNDDATLYVVQKSEKAFKLIDKVSLFAGVDAWAPLAVADGFMLLRDSKKMICIDLKK